MNIYIKGIQGSGKTTLSIKLKKKYPYMTVVHLDYFEFDEINEHKFYRNWVINHMNKYFIRQMKLGKQLSDKKQSELIEQFIEWSNMQNNYIIEGVQIIGCEDLIDTNKHKIINVKVPYNIAKKRVLKRDGYLSDYFQ